jgi:hypothetical protein
MMPKEWIVLAAWLEVKGRMRTRGNWQCWKHLVGDGGGALAKISCEKLRVAPYYL